MWIYGADFSGARDPSKRIYYAKGLLEKGSIIIKEIVLCDDRLDLFCAIHRSKAPWGLDFPFSLSKEAMEKLDIKTWRELLEVVTSLQREEYFQRAEEKGLPPCERRCKEPSLCCRATDVSISSFSPLKKTNPMMRAMVYGGWKLLSYLSWLGNRVYPFHQLDKGFSRLYEVYPSHTWKELGLSRSVDLKDFMEQFKGKSSFKVEIAPSSLQLESLDAADAVVACLTLGWALEKWELEEGWSAAPPFVSSLEWELRSLEGIVVRI